MCQLRYKANTMYQLSQYLDWFSIKLTGICFIGLAINPTPLVAIVTIAAGLSTLIYNAIRIIKELKSK